MRAIALLSGGLDSVVATWAAHVQMGAEIVAVITCDYGQRAAKNEIKSAARVAERLGAKQHVVKLPWLGSLGGSALTDTTTNVPLMAAETLDDFAVATETANAVWVPNRNGVLLNVAAAFADTLDADAVIVGFNREEAVTFPDNTPEFMIAADAFFSYSTKCHCKVISPTAPLSKVEIVRLGIELHAPLDCLWSCYHEGSEHCWTCESCRRLERALNLAKASHIKSQI